MNAKVFSIVLTVVAALILVMVLVQKNGYVSQAQENYDKKAAEYKTYGTNTTEFVNTSISLNKQAWAIACGIAEKGVASSRDQGVIERAVAPSIKGSDNFKTMVRHFEISPNYFIETTYKKVDEDKKNGLKFLSGFASMNINALRGNPSVAAEEDDEDEEEEAEEAEAPAPEKKAAKASKKKAKKAEAPAKKSKKRR